MFHHLNSFFRCVRRATVHNCMLRAVFVCVYECPLYRFACVCVCTPTWICLRSALYGDGRPMFFTAVSFTHTLNYLFLHFCCNTLSAARVCVCECVRVWIVVAAYESCQSSLYSYMYSYLPHDNPLSPPSRYPMPPPTRSRLQKLVNYLPFAFIPYTYAHKLSWVYVLNFTSHPWCKGGRGVAVVGGRSLGGESLWCSVFRSHTLFDFTKTNQWAPKRVVVINKILFIVETEICRFVFEK